MSRQGVPTPPEALETFLEKLREGLSVTAACSAADIGRSTVYEWRQRDEEFEVAWHDAIEAGTDAFEDEARRRAVDGTLRPVFQSGAEVGQVREYSDRLLELMLKARRPQVYRERVDVSHSGQIARPSAEELAANRAAGMDDDLEAAMAELARLDAARSRGDSP